MYLQFFRISILILVSTSALCGKYKEQAHKNNILYNTSISPLTTFNGIDLYEAYNDGLTFNNALHVFTGVCGGSFDISGKISLNGDITIMGGDILSGGITFLGLKKGATQLNMGVEGRIVSSESANKTYYYFYVKNMQSISERDKQYVKSQLANSTLKRPRLSSLTDFIFGQSLNIAFGIGMLNLEKLNASIMPKDYVWRALTTFVALCIGINRWLNLDVRFVRVFNSDKFEFLTKNVERYRKRFANEAEAQIVDKYTQYTNNERGSLALQITLELNII